MDSSPARPPSPDGRARGPGVARAAASRTAAPVRWNRVAIVGVGLIGGSIGLALRQRKLAGEVIGIGRRAASLRQAEQAGAITSATKNLEAGVAEADLIVVCAPVLQIAPLVEQVAAACPPQALITDAGSTKVEILRRLSKSLPRTARFVGSHPMAGGEKAGAAWASADLFVNRHVIVTPGPRTRDVETKEAADFWRSLGAEVLLMRPAAHDRLVAAISHLPHLVAAALAASTPEAALGQAARGWLDTTRVAGGDPELWRDIFATNRANLLAALARFEKTLAAFRGALEAEEDGRLIGLLAKGKRNRDAVGS